MKNMIRTSAASAVLALAFLANAAWAQDSTAAAPAAPAASAAATAPAGKPKHKDREDMVEQRIADLHSQLGITDAQSQQWDAFAQTMRDNAHKTDEAFKDRAQKFHSLSADDAMKSYAQLAQLHADNMQKMAAAFSTLYASLSDEQKQTADKVFRYEVAKHHKEHHHKAAPAASAAPAATPAPN
jgi:hypothetical protein